MIYNGQKNIQTAFTLVEVTLALLIMSFAIITLMGLLPTGLDTFREAQETTIQAETFQNIFNEVQQTPFSQLSDSKVGSKQTWYFDESGRSTAKQDSNRFYTATVNLSDATTLPGSTASSHLKTLTITLLTQRDEASGQPGEKISFIIADNGF